jgi:hypothetical protein
MAATHQLEIGKLNSETINDANATAGVEYAVQGGLRAFSWQATYANAPSAVSIKLQGTVDFSVWFDLDTSTATGGETRTVIDRVVAGVRGYVNTITPHASGSDVTFKILMG